MEHYIQSAIALALFGSLRRTTAFDLLNRPVRNELIPLCLKYGLAVLPGRRWLEEF